VLNTVTLERKGKTMESSLETKMLAIEDLYFGDVILREAQLNSEKFPSLVQNIAKIGVQLPILVRPGRDGKYEVCDGCQRTRASEQAGLTHIPARIVEMTDDEAAIRQLMMNTHRIETKPADILNAMRKLMFRHPDWDQSRLAEELDYSQSQVSKYMSLKKLDPEVLELVNKGTIRLTNGYALTKAPHEVQRQLALELDENGMSIAQKADVTDFPGIVQHHVKAYRQGVKPDSEQLRTFKFIGRQTAADLLISEEFTLEQMSPEDDNYSHQAGMVLGIQRVLSVDPTSLARREQEKKMKELQRKEEAAKRKQKKQEEESQEIARLKAKLQELGIDE